MANEFRDLPAFVSTDNKLAGWDPSLRSAHLGFNLLCPRLTLNSGICLPLYLSDMLAHSTLVLLDPVQSTPGSHLLSSVSHAGMGFVYAPVFEFEIHFTNVPGSNTNAL